MSVLVARAIVAHPDPAAVIEEMCEHFSEDGAFITGPEGARNVTFDFGTAALRAEDGALHVRAEADDLIELYNFRWTMAQHIAELAGTDDFIWTGDASDLVMPPYFRLLTVTDVTRITPRMVRVGFACADVAAFANDEELHVRLYLPRAGEGAPQWPSVAPNGVPRHPSGDTAPFQRRYTIRRADAAAGRIEIDFVLHADAGPGSAFAFAAAPGQVIGMSGPGASSCPPDQDWYLIAGDETALPAIARIFDFLPETARGVAVIEVEDAGEKQDLRHLQGFEIRWVLRADRAAGGQSLAAAVKAVALPETGPYFWFSGEFNTFREMRSYARKDLGLKKHQHLVVSYWRDGEGGHDTAA